MNKLKIQISKLVTALILIGSLPIILLSCTTNNDDVRWDLTIMEIKMKVRDNKGNNLLDPDYDKNIIHSGIKAEYRGILYDLIAFEDVEDPTTLNGLVWKRDYDGKDKGEYIMEFGKLDNTKIYENEIIKIIWPNESYNTIKFNYRRQGKNGITEIKEYFLDDKVSPYPIVIIR